jgi:hypothetical protein
MEVLACSSAVIHDLETGFTSTCPLDDHLQVLLRTQPYGPVFQKRIPEARSRARTATRLLERRPRAWLPTLALNSRAHDQISLPDHKISEGTHTKLVCFPLSCAGGLTAVQVYTDVHDVRGVPVSRFFFVADNRHQW